MSQQVGIDWEDIMSQKRKPFNMHVCQVQRGWILLAHVVAILMQGLDDERSVS